MTEIEEQQVICIVSSDFSKWSEKMVIVVVVVIVILMLAALLAYDSGRPKPGLQKISEERAAFAAAVGQDVPILFKTQPMKFSDPNFRVFQRGLAVTPDAIWLFDEGKTRSIARCSLIAAEIITDSETVMESRRLSQLSGAAVGAFIAGPAGMIIGGTTGKKVTRQSKPSNVILRLLLDDEVAPRFEINTLTILVAGETPDGSKALTEAQDWHDRLRVVMAKEDAGNSGPR